MEVPATLISAKSFDESSTVAIVELLSAGFWVVVVVVVVVVEVVGAIVVVVGAAEAARLGRLVVLAATVEG